MGFDLQLLKGLINCLKKTSNNRVFLFELFQLHIKYIQNSNLKKSLLDISLLINNSLNDDILNIEQEQILKKLEEIQFLKLFDNNIDDIKLTKNNNSKIVLEKRDQALKKMKLDMNRIHKIYENDIEIIKKEEYN